MWAEFTSFHSRSAELKEEQRRMPARSGTRSGEGGWDIVTARENGRERDRRRKRRMRKLGKQVRNERQKATKADERAVQMAENRWFLVKIEPHRRRGYQAALNWTTIIISTGRPFRPRLFLQRRILFQPVPGNCRFDDAGQAEPAFTGKERREKERERARRGKERTVMDVATRARLPFLWIFQREWEEKFDWKAYDFFSNGDSLQKFSTRN